MEVEVFEQYIKDAISSEIGRIILLYGNVQDKYFCNGGLISLRQLIEENVRLAGKEAVYCNPTEQRLEINFYDKTDGEMYPFRSVDECVFNLKAVQDSILTGTEMPVIDLSTVNYESRQFKETVAQLPAIFNNDLIGNGKLILICRSKDEFNATSYKPFTSYVEIPEPSERTICEYIRSRLPQMGDQDIKHIVKKYVGSPLRMIEDHISEIYNAVICKKVPLKTVLRNKYGERIWGMPDFSVMKHFHGQEEVLTEYKKLLTTIGAGRSVSEKMKGMFLFTGPAGCGKTYLGQLTAEVFGEKNYGYINMSSYNTSNAILGAERGYVGYGQQSVAAQQIKPNKVIIFDEIDKCSDLLALTNAFLAVGSTGVIYDNNGEVIDMTQKLCIFTANIGTGEMLSATNEKSYEQRRKSVLNQLHSFFSGALSPFYDRFDEVFVFKPLAPDEILKIAVDKVHDEEVNLSAIYPNIRITLTQTAIRNLSRIVTERELTSGRQVGGLVRKEVLAGLDSLLLEYVPEPDKLGGIRIAYDNGFIATVA